MYEQSARQHKNCRFENRCSSDLVKQILSIIAHLTPTLSCMSLEVPFLGTKSSLTLGGKLLTCEGPAGYQGAHAGRVWETHSNSNQNDVRRRNTAQRQRSARQPYHESKERHMKQHNSTWNKRQKEHRHQWNKSGLSQNRPAVITESGRSSNWCQTLFTCYFHIKWHFQGASSRASAHQCGIWGNWQQGQWVCS